MQIFKATSQSIHYVTTTFK